MADGANVISQDFSSPHRLAATVINSLLSYLLAEQMKITSSNADIHEVQEDRSGIEKALAQLAMDNDADLDALLDNPTTRKWRRAGATACRHVPIFYCRRRPTPSNRRPNITCIWERWPFYAIPKKPLMRMRKALKLDPDNAEGWRQLGVLHIRRGDYAEAKTALQQAQTQAGRSNDKSLEARAAGNLGAIDFYQGRFTQAEQLFSIDHNISRDLGNRPGIARSSGNLGLIYKKLERYGEAEIMHLEALEVARQIGNREEQARQIGNIGEVKRSQGDLEAAIDYHSRALALDEELENREGAARHAGNLGEVYRKTASMTERESCFAKPFASTKISKTAPAKRGIWQILEHSQCTPNSIWTPGAPCCAP